MAYNAKGQKNYNKKSIQFNTIYRPGTDLIEGLRLKVYLEETGQSANSYIKKLIKKDLDEKGIEILDHPLIAAIKGSNIVDDDNEYEKVKSGDLNHER